MLFLKYRYVALIMPIIHYWTKVRNIFACYYFPGAQCVTGIITNKCSPYLLGCVKISIYIAISYNSLDTKCLPKLTAVIFGLYNRHDNCVLHLLDLTTPITSVSRIFTNTYEHDEPQVATLKNRCAIV